VLLNNEHSVVKDLDITKEVGTATRLDKLVEFAVEGGSTRLKWAEQESKIVDGEFTVTMTHGGVSHWFLLLHRPVLCPALSRSILLSPSRDPQHVVPAPRHGVPNIWSQHVVVTNRVLLYCAFHQR
jgi:hypothetical protein